MPLLASLSITAVLSFAAASPQVSAPPLELQLSAAKPRTLVGESIELNVHYSVRADIDMETVELNLDRTRIRVTPLGGGPVQILSGSDYLRLRHESPLGGVGRRFHAVAGGQWTNRLSLFDYTLPLPAGRYRIELTYRDPGGFEAHAGPVEVEVAPATLISVSDRWFWIGAPRNLLGSVWTASDGGTATWFYQEAAPFDPRTVFFAVEIARRPVSSVPHLAWLEGGGSELFQRWVTWLEGDQLCWLRVYREGAVGPARCSGTGLARGDARLVDPPLQRRDGGLAVMVLGSDGARPAISAMEVVPSGQARRTIIPLPGPAPGTAAVFWKGGSAESRGELYWSADDGSLRSLEVRSGQTKLVSNPGLVAVLLGGVRPDWSQMVFGVVREGKTARVEAWDPAISKPQQRILGSYDVGTETPLVDAALSGDEKTGLALLFRSSGKWKVLAGRREATLAGGTGPGRLIVTSEEAVFLLTHDKNKGFVGEQVLPPTRVRHAPEP